MTSRGGAVREHLLRRLPALPQVLVLNLRGTGVSTRGLEQLAKMPRLTQVDLSDNSSLTLAALDKLASTATLRQVTLQGVALPLESVAAWKQAHWHVRVVE